MFSTFFYPIYIKYQHQQLVDHLSQKGNQQNGEMFDVFINNTK